MPTVEHVVARLTLRVLLRPVGFPARFEAVAPARPTVAQIAATTPRVRLVAACCIVATAAPTAAFAAFANRKGFLGQFRDTNILAWASAIALFAALELFLEAGVTAAMLREYPHAASPSVGQRIRGAPTLSCLIVYFLVMFLASAVSAIAFVLGAEGGCVTFLVSAALLFALCAALVVAQRHRTFRAEEYAIDSPLYVGAAPSPGSGDSSSQEQQQQQQPSPGGQSAVDAVDSPPGRNDGGDGSPSEFPVLLNSGPTGSFISRAAARPAQLRLPGESTGGGECAPLLADSREREQRSCGVRWCSGALTAAHLFARLAFLIFAALILMGGYVAGRRATFTVRGAFARDVGKAQYTVLYRCVGSRNSPHTPIFVIDSNPSRSSAAFWPLQDAFAAAGLRSCIFDKPGVGFSSWYDDAQDLLDLSSFYADLIASLGEEPPFVMVGVGSSGARNIWQYAQSQSPDTVAAVVFIDAFFGNVEWRAHAEYENISSISDLAVYRDQIMGTRLRDLQLLRGFGVPWGLMPIFLSSNSSEYADPQSFSEYQWFNYLAKTWTTHFFTLLSVADRGECGDGSGPTSLCEGAWRARLHPNIRTHAIITDPPIEYVCRGIARDSAECRRRLFDLDFDMRDAMQLLLFVSNNTSVDLCRSYACTAALPFAAPHRVVESLIAANLTSPGW